ncbi:XrtA/PEP-CTERM system-associated ATPase [Geobacter sp. AOG2]|uniref:XrtA/PEP-CTERM system-associated ATPase n=1 Tax=Geobacter sp. AOG2 TaxID=1566347 RepID=UPI001CC782CE|nr:XrtA/PEP-CTERM system-associated ATPase [Geobacter sp. AOG2]GFE60813.1 ATPase [Geobacter sp. AOG2]
MYETFYNLRVKPFELVPDPKFIYLSKSHKKALTFLDYGIRERAGFILLTGEVGSGKTTIIRDLLNKRYEQLVLAKVFNTRVTSEQLLAMINDDFGLQTQNKDKVTLIRDLNEFLVEQYARGNHPILIIDEAQNLAEELLEEVRMLSNLETSDCKLLQIILVGQPELRTILSAPSLRQLRQRISINCHLQSLNRQETERYIMHRLEVAGNALAVEFPFESLDVVFRYSKGIPRLINIICDFLMLSAFAEEMRVIPVEMVREVIGDLDFDNHFWSATVTVPPGGQPADAGACLQRSAEGSLNQDVSDMLTDISRRMDALENNLGGSQVQTVLNEFQDRFTQLQNNVTSHMAKSDSQIFSLLRKLDEIAVPNKSEIPTDISHESTNVGFVRRVFGGDPFSRRK